MESKEELLKKMTDEIMDLLIQKYTKNPELFQIACNTAAINTLLTFRPELLSAVYAEEK